MIRRGGLNISSAEVEGVLLEHPGVVEAAVVPLPNPVLGSDVRGVVVPADPRPTPEELIAFCAERLADYKGPDPDRLHRRPAPQRHEPRDEGRADRRRREALSS